MTNRLRTVSMIAATAACAFGFTGLVHAQWTDDPSLNTPIVIESGDQVQPKVARAADGGAYISWFDNRTGGFDVYMQRIDANGEPQWQENGILIADRSFSSTQDYDLTVDDEGHAIVAFRDDRFGGIVVTASRVAPDGTQVWGPTGVQPSMTTGFIGAILVEAAGDGTIAVGWYNGEAARVVKLDGDGEELWGTDIGNAPAGSFTVSDLIASDADGASGEVIVLMTTIGGFIQPRHLYAQKLDADGETMWAEPTPIYTQSSLQVAYFPTGASDGAGGLVTAWYHVNPLQVRVQHVDADGAVQFGANGTVASTNAAQLRVSPSAAHEIATGETYVFWRELDSFQNAVGVFGQKFDANGQRQWNDSGVSIFNSGNETTQVRTLLHDDGAQVYFVERTGPASQRVFGTFVDDDGTGGGLIDVSDVNSSKSRLAALLDTNHQAVLVWQDSRNGPDDLFAQNVNADGTLGPIDDGPLGDLNGDGVVNVFDLLILLENWGACADPTDCPADLNGDGLVNVFDLLILLENWG